MQELSRIITALGVVAAATGLTIYGMGASYFDPGDFDTMVGLWMMILGTIAAIVGAILYRQSWVEEDD